MLAEIIPSWESRPDSEHEQAIIRFLVGIVASIFILLAIWLDRGSIKNSSSVIIGIIVFFILAFSIILSIIKNPGVNIPRRIFGCIIDNSGVTALLLINGNLAAPIFIIYLWVTFGNGFRFGRQYLHFSMTLNIIGFCSVLLFSNEWSEGLYVNIGLLVGLIALPLYVGSLLKKLEIALIKAQAANRAKSNFLATMSHEIRTPLNGLIGILDLLDMTDLQSQQQYYVDLMKNSSRWLLNVISDGLDFTKIEANELIIAPVPTDIKTTFLTLCQVYEEVAQKNGLLFKKDFKNLSDHYVSCDPDRLTQVLNNLLNNCCKFTKKGSVNFKVSSEILSSNMARLSFNVNDTGIGIAAENIKSIFLPFKQIRSEGSDIFSGTGLGLTISSRLVKLMGGEIQVESKPDVGTTFSFYIDVPIVPQNKIQKRGLQKIRLHWNRKPQILLVEDNTTNQEVAKSYLKQLGCEVQIAGDGFEAVELVRKNIFDLIFMDCQMPKMDGYESTRKIRSLEHDHNKNIIIALTAHITKLDREKCFEVGMDDYIGKPYNFETLQQCLSKWLDSLVMSEDMPKSTKKMFPKKEINESNNTTQNNKTLHELRNELGKVIGGVELAIISQEDPIECERRLQTALKGAQQAVFLSKNIT